MDGVHDLGGRHGFGPIAVAEAEQNFAEPWEARAYALCTASDLPDWTIDWWRHIRELIDPVDYLSRPYFDSWIQTQIAGYVDSGVIRIDELRAGRALSAGAGTTLQAATADGVPASERGLTRYDRPLDSRPAFASGQPVRACGHGVLGHTRLPGYVRGRPGVILTHHGGFAFADAAARGEERAEHLYTVAFRIADLFPEADPSSADTVRLDLWESYLERR